MPRLPLKTLILLLISISTLASKPKWISNIDSKCKGSQLCAVGEGTSLTFAKINATAEISKIFSNRVKASFKNSIEYLPEETLETASEQIEEFTEMELSGVEHPLVHEDVTSFYVFATLNKRKFADQIRKQFDSRNDEIEELTKSKNINIFKVRDLFAQQEVLNQQYKLLTGFELRSFVSVKKILKIISKNQGQKIFVNLKNGDLKGLGAVIEGMFSSAGYTISKKGSYKTLNVGLISEKQYFNVEGFVKYKFTITFEHAGSKAVKQGVLTGVSKQQALDKMIEVSKKDLKETLGNLRL